MYNPSSNLSLARWNSMNINISLSKLELTIIFKPQKNVC